MVSTVPSQADRQCQGFKTLSDRVTEIAKRYKIEVKCQIFSNCSGIYILELFLMHHRPLHINTVFLPNDFSVAKYVPLCKATSYEILPSIVLSTVTE